MIRGKKKKNLHTAIYIITPLYLVIFIQAMKSCVLCCIFSAADNCCQRQAWKDSAVYEIDEKAVAYTTL